MNVRRIPALAAALASALAVGSAPARAAEAVHGITAKGQLVTFHSDSPGAMRSSVPITGLAPGEALVALDGRPRTGQLYALSSASRLYTVNPVSGAATAVGTAFAPLLAGTSFGLDVDSASDRIRVVSDGRQNLRLSPEDGQVAGHDQPLAYAIGDSGEGANPGTGAAAFTHPADGQPRLFLIDTARDVLAAAPAPAQGQLATVGPLGVDIREPAAFDIATDGRAWVTAPRAGRRAAELFLADVAAGTIVPAAQRAVLGARVIAITTAGPVPDDLTRPSVLLSTDTVRTIASLGRTSRASASCSEACRLTATLRAGRQILARGTAVTRHAGRVGVVLQPTRAGRALARAGRPLTATLNVTAADAAFNHARSARRVRFG